MVQGKSRIRRGFEGLIAQNRTRYAHGDFNNRTSLRIWKFPGKIRRLMKFVNCKM